jgi:hypothetical protein
MAGVANAISIQLLWFNCTTSAKHQTICIAMSMVMDELGWPYLTYVGFGFKNVFKRKWRI